MGLRLAVAMVMLVSSGCAGGTVYYAEGVDIATREADYAQCESLALSEYPVRSQTRFTPRIYVPAHQVCRAGGTCTIVPGYFDGGEPYTVDANAEFRRNAVRGCMGERGYARVALPQCRTETTLRPSPVMPPLTEGTCLYRPTGSGPALIVNPI